MTAAARILPKEIMVFDYSPGRSLAHLIVELKNVPGALQRCAALIAREGVNVLSGFHVAPTAKEEAYWSFFADFSRANLTPAELILKLRDLDVVGNATHNESKDGLLIDTSHFPITYSSFTAFLMRTDEFSQMLQRLYSMIGTPARVVFYQMGFVGGSTMISSLKRALGRDASRRHLSYLMSMYAALGWGVFELTEISFEKRRATVRALENIECKSFSRPSPEPKSNFVRGHLSGLFTEVFEERMDAKEVRCYSVGDEYCEFLLFPATE